MLHSGRYIFINGESYQVKTIDKQALSQLADARTLDGALIAKASDDLREALYLWYQDGWLEALKRAP